MIQHLRGWAGTNRVELLSTMQVAQFYRDTYGGDNKGNKKVTAEVYDLITGISFKISWASTDNYHSDWSPLTMGDTELIKGILCQGNRDVNWSDYLTWESMGAWGARVGILRLDGLEGGDGHLIAIGYHLRPHGSTMGGESGLPSDSNVSYDQRNPQLDNWPLGGHMDMYFYDSPMLTSKRQPYRDAAFASYYISSWILD